MAKTIFDPVPMRGLPRPYVPLGAPDPDPEIPAEPEVAADPPLARNVVGYMEPREGIDGKSYFGQCASCSSFVPETLMRGAVRGDRCQKFGGLVVVTDDLGCNLWTPWPDGRPDVDCQDDAAGAMIAGQRAAVSPWDANFAMDKRRQCVTCRHVEIDEKAPCCAMMEDLNSKIPAVFAMQTEVKLNAKCNLWTDQPPPEPIK